jgi:hypothetical protein
MINFKVLFAASFVADLWWFSWIPSALLAVILLINVFYSKLVDVKSIRFAWCFQVVILICVLSPYAALLAPGGGPYEQQWLDHVIAHLETKRETCEDPKMQEIIDYTIRRYDYIGPFGVRVVQLPEDTLGYNNPFCRGVTVDESLLDFSLAFGASILVHEAMHDYFPHFGHYHIDDNRIWEAVQ